MKLERLLAMLFILMENKNVRAIDLAQRFEVSIRTIYRDIDTLSAAGIPIYTNQGRNGGICIMDEYVFNKSLLSKEEQAQIITSLKSLKTIEAGSETTLEKLQSFFHHREESWIDLDFASWGGNNSYKQPLLALKEAILNHYKVSFVYHSMKEAQSDRQVEPYQVIYKGQDWYLYAYCLKKEAFRYFKLSRMRHLEVESQTFIKRDLPEQEEIILKEEMISVKCRINKGKGYRVLDDFAHELIEEGSDYFLVVITMSKQWVYSYLLSYQDDLEVLEPLEVREKMKAIIQQLQNKYKT